PSPGMLWTINTKQNVTWEVSDPPEHIINYAGSIRLRKGDTITPSTVFISNLVVLTDGFDIFLGTIEIEVPWVIEGDGYCVSL
ncbi:hypothetical protein DFS33DRAFT_1240770, partial [Desarmillaria ectypa]